MKSDPSFRSGEPRRAGQVGRAGQADRPARAARVERHDRARGVGDGDRSPADPTGIQRLAVTPARASSKVQQRFARLIKQVDQRKQRLRSWVDVQPAIHRELAAYRAAREAYRRTSHDLVCLCDRVHGDPIFNRPERQKLRALICQIAGDLLAEPGCDDLKPIYNRHSRSDFDAEAAFEDAVSARMMRSMMEDMFGMDFGDADVSSTEKLEEYTAAQLHTFEQEQQQQQQQAEDRRARRKKSARQVAQDARREAEKTKIGKVLQEVYRKLAVALHPDLEQDPGERTRKTELMQQVNVAYESQDLLRLLELQLELEQIDPDHASEVAEDRLRHYNTILDQQVKQLDLELDELELPWRMELELSPSQHVSPHLVLTRIRADVEEVHRENARLGRDLKSFQDRSRLKAWLRSSGRRSGNARPDADLFGQY
jgi:hypothetical protein